MHTRVLALIGACALATTTVTGNKWSKTACTKKQWKEFLEKYPGGYVGYLAMTPGMIDHLVPKSMQSNLGGTAMFKPPSGETKAGSLKFGTSFSDWDPNYEMVLRRPQESTNPLVFDGRWPILESGPGRYLVVLYCQIPRKEELVEINTNLSQWVDKQPGQLVLGGDNTEQTMIIATKFTPDEGNKLKEALQRMNDKS